MLYRIVFCPLHNLGCRGEDFRNLQDGCLILENRESSQQRKLHENVQVMGNDAMMYVERACTTVYSVVQNKSRNPGACSDVHESVTCISGTLVDLKIFTAATRLLLQVNTQCRHFTCPVIGYSTLINKSFYMRSLLAHNSSPGQTFMEQ